MNFPRFLSFAIPAAIIIFAILGNAVTLAAAQVSRTSDLQRPNVKLVIGLGIVLGGALLVLVATVYGVENLI